MPRTKRHAVYLVTTANDFQPSAPWDLPAAMLSATLLHRDGYARARQAVHQVNTDQLQAIAAGTWDRTWAILVAHVRPRVLPQAIAARKGGA